MNAVAILLVGAVLASAVILSWRTDDADLLVVGRLTGFRTVKDDTGDRMYVFVRLQEERTVIVPYLRDAPCVIGSTATVAEAKTLLGKRYRMVPGSCAR